MKSLNTYLSQTSTSWETRYTFSGKEKDAETGYSYFGARYYDSDVSLWLSVDPLSDEYPSTSPFMYVLGKPTALIDPNGMNAWIPPTEQGGAWTAEAGDGAWDLFTHPENTASWDEVKGAVSAMNAARGESSEYMVHPNDKVSGIGGGPSLSNVQTDNESISYNPDLYLGSARIPTYSSSSSEGEIKPYTPDVIDKWSESGNFFASLSYSMIDDVYVYGSSLMLGPRKARHLTGEGANRKELTQSGVNTITNAAPFGSIGKLIGIEKNVLNAAEFGVKFKGTKAVQIPHSVRGNNIRKYNHAVKHNNMFKTDIKYISKGATGIGYSVNN